MVQAHPLLRSRCSELRRQPSAATLWRGTHRRGNMAPQAQTQAAQNTAQGDAATPLETGVRQRGDAEKQRAAEVKPRFRHGSVDTRAGGTDHGGSPSGR
jgi:hypothetical protein